MKEWVVNYYGVAAGGVRYAIASQMLQVAHFPGSTHGLRPWPFPENLACFGERSDRAGGD